MPTVPHEKTIQRLMSKVDTSAGMFECWPWFGANDGLSGYGHLAYDGRWIKAHRLAYILFVGPIPEGHDVLHTCDNPPCCNPTHLFTGTHSDNMQDREAKGRHNAPHGEHQWAAKLTADQVREIRALRAQGVPYKELRRRFGVTDAAIGAVIFRRTWRHIK